MTDRSQTPSCTFVGATSLLVDCARHARKAGWDVRAIVSDDDRVNAWATDHGIPVLTWVDLETGADVRADCLFSVVNHRLIRQPVLERYRFAANFHDAILPGHRGVNCAAWALANGDGFCGVTWHGVTDEVDGGAVLCQGQFRVRADDSAFSLSARCADLAAELFVRLLNTAADPSAATDPRAVSVDPGPLRRKRDAPPNAGILVWTEPAWKLRRLVQATDSGLTPNTFGSAAIALPEGLFYVVDAADRLHTVQEAHHRPGSILSSLPDEVAIVCGDGDILDVRRIVNGRGVTVAPVSLPSLRVGQVLRIVPEAEIQLASGLIAAAQSGEIEAARLIRAGGSELRPTAGPRIAQTGHTGTFRGRRPSALAAAVLVLGTLAGGGHVRFALRRLGQLPKLTALWRDFLSTTIPVEIDTGSEPRAALHSCSRLLDRPASFVRSDLAVRYGDRLLPRWDFAIAVRGGAVPAVGFEGTAAMPDQWPMTVVLADRESVDVSPSERAEATFVIGNQGDLGWTVTSSEDIAGLVRHATDRLRAG